MMKRSDFTLLIDMDDTIENLLDAWLLYLNKRYSCNVQTSDITSWHITDFFPSLTREQVYSPLYINKFWSTVKPKKDAVEYLNIMYNEGYNIYICTCSNFKTMEAKYRYIINRYFPYIDREHIIVTANKQMIKADVLIDDGPHNLINGEYSKILVDSPHNRYFNAKENNAIRCNNWKDIYNTVESLYAIKKMHT